MQCQLERAGAPRSECAHRVRVRALAAGRRHVLVHGCAHDGVHKGELGAGRRDPPPARARRPRPRPPRRVRRARQRRRAWGSRRARREHRRALLRPPTGASLSSTSWDTRRGASSATRWACPAEGASPRRPTSRKSSVSSSSSRSWPCDMPRRRPGRPRPEHRAHPVAHARLGQRRRVQQARRRFARGADRGAGLPASRVASRSHQQHRQALQPARKEAEEPGGILVGPFQVVRRSGGRLVGDVRAEPVEAVQPRRRRPGRVGGLRIAEDLAGVAGRAAQPRGALLAVRLAQQRLEQLATTPNGKPRSSSLARADSTLRPSSRARSRADAEEP